MRKFLLAIVFVLFSGTSMLIAQISQGGIPFSFKYNIKTDIDKIELQPRQMSYVLNEEEKLVKDGSLPHIGYSLSTDISIDNSGTWTELPDGGRIWQLQIKAPSALAMVIYYDNFKLPVGTKLFLYNEDKTQVIGAYTWYNNDPSGYFANELIYGDIVNLEYYEPEKVFSKPSIHINQIGYIYRGVSMKRNTNWAEPSEACEININCSPVGDNWQDEKQGVARILVTTPGGQGWCTGSLVNNTNQNCTPYFLTAWHCYENATASQLNQWIFYFNYEASGCTTPSTEPSSNTMTGASLKASADITGGSDFILLQLNQSVPISYNPYMNGWSRANSVTGPGVGIHHPASSIKKISTFNSAATGTYSGSASNAHWEILWVSNSNGWGVTEGGSSGSPIFDANGRIVGTLTGGSSDCTTQSNPDYYGKIFYHWDQNGASASVRLKDWLDPAGTNPATLDGKYCTGSTPVCDTVDLMSSGLYWLNFANGNNSYGDLVKANYFANTTNQKTVQDIYVQFIYAKGTGNATVAVWNNSGTSGSPGASPLATTTVPISTIISDVNATQTTLFHLATPLSLTGPCYIGVILPTVTGDTVVLLADTSTNSSYNVAWEKWNSGLWYAYNSGSSWGKNTALAIVPVICTTVGISEIENTPLSVFPNPAENEIFVVLPNSAGDKVKISIFDIYGKLCKQTEISSYTEPARINLNELTNGIYFLQGQTKQGKFIEKILIVK